jgi:cell pole-organizing protein PopZ
MEEILASIRRIIADDDRAKPQAKAPEPPPAPPPAPPPQIVAPPPAPPIETVKQDEIDAMMAKPEPIPQPEPATDILDLTEQMTAPPPAPEGFRTIDGESDLVFEEAPPPAPPPAPEPPRPMAPPAYERPLVSSATSAAVDSAFNTLAHTVLVQNARTLEDLVREMLRPMLKTWLDDNLPGMVERLVRAEIERVSRGRS